MKTSWKNFLLLSIVTFFLLGCSKELVNSPLRPPLEKFAERPKILTFGLYVTPDPEQNPIDPPERFTGYHTALDLEIFENEKDAQVPVFAICDGEIIEARTADGYGGVLIHSCTLDNQEVTILYGHLDPNSFTYKKGDKALKGEKLGILANAQTKENGFNRKHLHLGIHKGKDIQLAGYVQSEKALEEFINPQSLLSF